MTRFGIVLLVAALASPAAADSPLHYAAAFHDHTDNGAAAAAFAVPWLLSAGADPNACVAPQ